MSTIATIASKIVEINIDMGYVQDCGFTTVGEVYNSEFGYNGLSDKACKDYLQGLPSVCTVPFENFKILEVLEAYGIRGRTERAQDVLIEKYWNACGAILHKMIRRGK